MLVILSVVLFAFNPFQGKDNTLTAAEKKAGWVLLFDGTSVNGWRTYNNQPQDSWEVVKGELHCKDKDVKQRADLMPLAQYGDFELSLDWKVAKGANSGIVYHVVENDHASYESGPEYQLIDNVGYEHALEGWQKSGADYAMHPPSKITSKPAGEYNHTKLIVRGSHVEHWLNGEKVVDFELWTPEWQALKAQGKWKDINEYGMAKKGYIGLQDHGGGIWFKNIKLRTL
jgi:Domain of Unknown Function (DUF1080)